MKFGNNLKNSLFLKSLVLEKSNSSKIGLIVLFDAMFLISLFILQRLADYFAASLSFQPSASIYVYMVFSLIYYLMVFSLYVIFKYIILNFIKSLFGRTQILFGKLGQFYLLNLIIAGVFLAIMLLLNFILYSLKQAYAPYVFIVMAIPYLLFLYIVINLAHSVFYEGASIKNTLKCSFKAPFAKIKSYRENVLIMIFFGFLLWILLLGSGYLLRLATSGNQILYLDVYPYFKQTSIIIMDIIIYFAILTNRISFYISAKEIR